MNLILDTHVAIWFITDDKQLPTKVRALIEDPNNDCVVSIASFWEIGIKYALGKLALDSDLETIFRLIQKSGIATLPISVKHILSNSQLPLFHRDPFDRLIIAQAISENYTLVSKDSEFDTYPLPIVWLE